MNNNERLIPTLLIVTSNSPAESYEGDGDNAPMLARYKSSLSNFVGKTRTLVCGDTLQVKDYSRFDWTLFDPAQKKRRHEDVFPSERKKAYRLGEQMAAGEW